MEHSDHPIFGWSNTEIEWAEYSRGFSLLLRGTNKSPTEEGQEALSEWLGSVLVGKANMDSES